MVTSQIIVDVLANLDHIWVFDCLARRKPFLFFDGHGSQFELTLLRYVINKVYEWVIYIGVPYGTSLWQAGDSSEQNRVYNMAFSTGKNYWLKRNKRK